MLIEIVLFIFTIVISYFIFNKQKYEFIQQNDQIQQNINTNNKNIVIVNEKIDMITNEIKELRNNIVFDYKNKINIHNITKNIINKKIDIEKLKQIIIDNI